MYSVGGPAPPLLLFPLFMHLMFLHGGSIAAPLFFNATNSTESVDIVIMPLIQETIVNVQLPFESMSGPSNLEEGGSHVQQDAATFQSFIHSGRQFIATQLEYWRGVLFFGSDVPGVAPVSPAPPSKRRSGMLGRIDLV